MTDLVISETDIAVKQANRLIESIYKMELNEHKLLLLATKKVNEMELRNHPFNERTKITISSSEFADQYAITRQTAFDIIVDAKKSIYEREFDYLHVEESGTVTPMKSRWFQARGMDAGKGEISFMFASAVIPLIYLVKSEYTLLDLHEIGQLNSKYAVRLYKYLMRWVNAPYKNKISIEQLRVIFGLGEDEYPRLFDFKRRVLDVAVKMVKANTGFKDLTVKSYKTGVKVTDFSFHYTSYSNKLIKNARKQVIDGDSAPGQNGDDYVIYQMTIDQIETFSKTLALKASKSEPGYSELGSLVDAGQDWSVLAKRISEDFRKCVFEPYLEYLKLAGFKPTKLNKTPLPGQTEGNTAIDSGNEGEEPEKPKDNPFKLPDSLYARYVSKGGKMTKDQILEIAMAEDVKPVKVMLNDGINVLAI